jgi:hypothetical protein
MIENTYLHVFCEGDWWPAAVTEALRRVGETARRTTHTRILIDWRKVSPPIKEFHRFLAGLDVAGLLNWPMRVAALCEAESINRFAEDLAVNRGASLLVFAEKEDALAWLLREQPDHAHNM